MRVAIYCPECDNHMEPDFYYKGDGVRYECPKCRCERIFESYIESCDAREPYYRKDVKGD